MKPIDFNYSGKKLSIIGFSEQDWMYQIIEKTKTFYEIDLLEYIRFVLKGRRGLILDIGANIGNHSIYFGLFAGNVVASFEPNPSVSPILEKNLLVNGVNHKIFKFGLGSSEAKYSVEIPQGMSNNVGAAKLKQTNSGTIQVKKLDDTFPDVAIAFDKNHLVAIKADIEGMEADMLRGAMATLEKNKPDLFLEINTSEAMDEIWGILKPLGYKKIVSWAATPVWHFIHKEKMTFWLTVKIIYYILSRKTLLGFARRIVNKLRLAIK